MGHSCSVNNQDDFTNKSIKYLIMYHIVLWIIIVQIRPAIICLVQNFLNLKVIVSYSAKALFLTTQQSKTHLYYLILI